MIGHHVPRNQSSVALNESGKREASDSYVASQPQVTPLDGPASSRIEKEDDRQPLMKKLKRTNPPPPRHHNIVIKPCDYALAAFRANGVCIEDTRTRLASKFPPIPCTDVSLTNAYKAEVLEAMRKGDLTKLKELDESKTLNVNACNRWGDSLLHMACRRSQTEIVEFLLSKGANAHIRDDYHRTPLHDAAWTIEPNFELVDLLLKHGATYQVLMQDVRGFTPFDYVRQEHWGQWLRFLWERKSILKVEDHDTKDCLPKAT